MKKEYRDCYVINPNWVLLFILLFGIIIVTYCLANNLQSNLPHHNFSILHVLLLFIVLFAFGRKYVLHDKGISVYILGIRIQTINWYDVREVYIIQQKKLGQSDDRIYVFRNDSPYVGRDINQIGLFSLSHPFDVLIAIIPDKIISECTDAFHKFYGVSDAIILIKKE